MRIVVGLGNPGSAYAATRHNAGFMVVDRLVSRLRIDLAPARDGLRQGYGILDGIPIRLATPQRYMNRSGEVLAALDGEWQPADLIVVSDDIDLPAGSLRIRHDGGAGGHRGLESIIERWGSEFDRVRVGVGRPPVGDDPAAYVLAPLEGAALQALAETVERATDAVECLLRDGLNKAMNQFNGRRLLDSGGVA